MIPSFHRYADNCPAKWIVVLVLFSCAYFLLVFQNDEMNWVYERQYEIHLANTIEEYLTTESSTSNQSKIQRKLPESESFSDPDERTLKSSNNSSTSSYEHFCSCKRTKTQNYGSELNQPKSLCSRESDQRGVNQKVITYSLYGSMNDNVTLERYFKPFSTVLRQAKSYYPGWVVRLYHNFSASDTSAMEFLCHAYCRNLHLDLCNVTTLGRKPGLFSSVQRVNPRMWRFLPFADATVDVSISRDIDSFISARDSFAVQEWLNSSYTFHILRDHELHGGVILAGLWGAKVHQRRTIIKGMVVSMFAMGMDSETETDQKLLALVVWPLAMTDSMIHDSYFCQYFLFNPIRKARPFPVQRMGGHFLGTADGTDKPNITIPLASKVKPCPKACRPPKHQDWTFC